MSLEIAFAALVAVAIPPSAEPGEGLPATAPGQILVVGETHGSNEIPAYFLEQVRHMARSNFVTVGLELPGTSAQLRCTNRDWRRLPPGWTGEKQDGRTSRAMRALLCGLRDPSLARRVRVVYLDDLERGRDFDARAARRFLEASSGRHSHGLILTGNYHSRNNEGSLAWHLRQLGFDVRTVTVSSASAETWVCTGRPSSCGVRTSNINFCSGDPADARRTRWYSNPGPRFAWDFCLSLPALTASPPALSPPASFRR
ncbi:MAG TPA: hypothetical protein VEX35_03690 [Allosphingosinicella sp.]|nr:hypothetical protein [Allosphingosinicella sp.]